MLLFSYWCLYIRFFDFILIATGRYWNGKQLFVWYSIKFFKLSYALWRFDTRECASKSLLKMFGPAHCRLARRVPTSTISLDYTVFSPTLVVRVNNRYNIWVYPDRYLPDYVVVSVISSIWMGHWRKKLVIGRYDISNDKKNLIKISPLKKMAYVSDTMPRVWKQIIHRFDCVLNTI